jgi:hypothetical protein
MRRPLGKLCTSTVPRAQGDRETQTRNDDESYWSYGEEE